MSFGPRRTFQLSIRRDFRLSVMGSLNDSQIAHPGHEPKVVGTARCAVTARKAGGIIHTRSPDRRFMESGRMLSATFGM
jgi:hypothetical protein